MPDPDTVFVFQPYGNAAYMVHQYALPAARGRRMLAAAKVAREWIFANTAAVKLVGFTPSGNRPALIMAEMAGMRREGVLRKAYRSGDELQDLIVFGMCKEDFYQPGNPKAGPDGGGE